VERGLGGCSQSSTCDAPNRQDRGKKTCKTIQERQATINYNIYLGECAVAEDEGHDGVPVLEGEQHLLAGGRVLGLAFCMHVWVRWGEGGGDDGLCKCVCVCVYKGACVEECGVMRVVVTTTTMRACTRTGLGERRGGEFELAVQDVGHLCSFVVVIWFCVCVGLGCVGHGWLEVGVAGWVCAQTPTHPIAHTRDAFTTFCPTSNLPTCSGDSTLNCSGPETPASA
jgi:hypothetical protein